MTPPFAWLGGKEKLSRWILGFIPGHVTYCEPFAGSAAVLLAKEPSRVEVWNDAHEDLACFFRVLRDEDLAPRLTQLLQHTEFARRLWLHCRSRVLSGGPWKDDLDRAWCFGVVALMAFSGNASARTPTMATPGGTGPDITAKVIRKVDRLPELSKRLRHVYVENRDALTVIMVHDSPDTLFYVDPPYPGHDGPRNYRERTDMPALLALLRTVKGMVLLSGYDTPLHQEMLPGWVRHEHEVPLAVNNTHGATTRRRVVESLWLNPEAAWRLELDRRPRTGLQGVLLEASA